MTIERAYGARKVCLRRPHFIEGTDKLAPMGGAAYCDGNVCFGMGARGTHDPDKVTCDGCRRAYVREQMRKRAQERVDKSDGLQEDPKT